MKILLILFFVVVSIICAICRAIAKSFFESENQKAYEKEMKLLEELLNKNRKSFRHKNGVEVGRQYLLAEPIVLMETRRVRQGTAYAGPSVAIPLIKSCGLKIRAGYFAHTPVVKDQLVPICMGLAGGNDKEMIVVSDTVNRQLRLKEIVQVGMVRSSYELHCKSPYIITISRKRGKTWYVVAEHPAYITAYLMKYASHAFPIPETEEIGVSSPKQLKVF